MVPRLRRQRPVGQRRRILRLVFDAPSVQGDAADSMLTPSESSSPSATS